MRQISVSIGGKHNAKVRQTWRGSWERFCELMLKDVPETMAKDTVGWVCGAEFEAVTRTEKDGTTWTGPYRDSENFVARHLLSLDYDHITPEQKENVLAWFRGFAHLAYTTWSNTPERPRLRIFIPLSRPCGYDEFQAVSRRIAASAGIELAARESHVPAQYMFKPAIKPFDEFQSWQSEGPWIDVDKVLGEYDDWTDRSQWPHRAVGDGVHSEGSSVDPRTKPGIVGAFCRAFSVSAAIDQFDLPYTPSSPGRYTYTNGSRPDGCIVYDEDTKLHSHHDTDPARGQSNAFDLVRLHRFGSLDKAVANDLPLAQRPSSKRMAEWARKQPAVAAQFREELDFDDLEAEAAAADTSDWDDIREVRQAEIKTSTARVPKTRYKLSDQGNAKRIERRYGDKIIAIGGAFYCWAGTHWQEDENETEVELKAMQLSEIVAREADKREEEIKALALKENRVVTVEEEAEVAKIHAWAGKCCSRATRTACLGDLRAARYKDARELNVKKNLFSCANGTIDLEKGTLREHSPGDFITACSPTVFDPGAQAPRFQQFLREIYNDDEELVAFMRRWFGYCITGETNEHRMIFHVGRGGNGKGTMMDILSYVLGSGYYLTAPQKLMNLDETGATPDLANLLGRRMVTIRETDENLEIRDGLVKLLTGGDELSARKLYQEPISFTPTHKLQVFTNHAPLIRTQDFAMWRRIFLIHHPISYGDPYQVANGEAQRLKDPNLEAALKAEAPGILAWLVQGAKEWYSGRLQPPKAVLDATNSYRVEQDVIGQFAKERLVADPESWVAIAGVPESVFPAYRGWCTSMNCRPLGRTRLIRELLRVMPGSSSETKNGAQGFRGFKLAQQEFLD